MRLDTPLDDVLRARSHVQVLRTLHRLPPGITLSGREVARRSGISHPTATAALLSLGDLGIVRVRRAHRINSFEMNRDHVLADDLRRLFDREGGLRDDLVTFLRDRLERAGVPVLDAYLFGSAARGEMTVASDVDVALICRPADVSAVEEAVFGSIADAVMRRYGARLSPIIGTRPIAALRDPGNDGHPLWERIASEGLSLLSRSARQAL